VGRERLAIEFGRYSEWLVEAIQSLGIEDPVPAACRGTANPVLFEEAAGLLDVSAGDLVLDVGSGLGGPGAWLASQNGCKVVGVDVMEQSARGAHRLFPHLPTVVASSRALPFGDGVFDGAWCLGTIETIGDKQTALSEMVRVVKPGGRTVVYTFVVVAELDESTPLADRLEPRSDLEAKIAGAGFVIATSRLLEGLPAAPSQWKQSAKAVRGEVAARHSEDGEYSTVSRELDKVARLFSSDLIEPWIFGLQKEDQ
jgi:SAM-dependent methyltransferase